LLSIIRIETFIYKSFRYSSAIDSHASIVLRLRREQSMSTEMHSYSTPVTYFSTWRGCNRSAKAEGVIIKTESELRGSTANRRSASDKPCLPKTGQPSHCVMFHGLFLSHHLHLSCLLAIKF
ncbi:hypothetical protein KCU81_g424, partial [Aureobasidium melanogenum]